jgi:hypothetical protein
MTGEILDADVILTDGWIRVYEYRWNELIPDVAMEGMSPETLAWLDQNPQWDPRVRAAPAAERHASSSSPAPGVASRGSAVTPRRWATPP